MPDGSPFMSAGFALTVQCTSEGQMAGGAGLAKWQRMEQDIGVPTFMNTASRLFGERRGQRLDGSKEASPCAMPMRFLQMKSVPPAVALVVAPAPGAALEAPVLSMSFSGDLLFGFDKYGIGDLSPGGREALSRLAQQLGSGKAEFARLEIKGYTDPLGTNAYNQVLSQRRADTVKAYLVQQQVTLPIMAEGMGEAEQVKRCDDVKGTAALHNCLQPNRRVTAEVFGKSALR